jgi:hypothetical protein
VRISIFVILSVTLATFLAVARATAQTGDFNGDGLLDCGDIGLLNAEILTPTGASQFDLDESGTVDLGDVRRWLGAAGTARGFANPIMEGDANLDGNIDHVDWNIFALHFRMEAAGWCEGDFDGDGIANQGTDRVDIKISWQTSYANVPTNRFEAPVTMPPPTASLDVWAAGGFTFAQTEHFELISIPQRAPDGLLATVVAIRTLEPTDRIVTFTNLAVTGDLHQTWLSGPFGSPTAKNVSAGQTYPAKWIPFDSHLLFTSWPRPNMIGDGAGSGYFGISETNDMTIGEIPGLPLVQGTPSVSGIGPISMVNGTDAFFLAPAFQSDEVQIAFLVTPARTSNTGTVGEIFLTLGVLGGDENNEPIPYEGIFGLVQPIAIPFFAEPCDINVDGMCDVDDLNQLLAALGTENSEVNLDASNPLIDLSDRDAWLADAQIEAAGATFVTGDTDLDGDVDASDLNKLGLHWQMGGQLGWQAGDFDGSGMVDAADLNALSLHWRHGSVATTAVPESHGMAWLLAWSTATLMFRPRKRRKSSG